MLDRPYTINLSQPASPELFGVGCITGTTFSTQRLRILLAIFLMIDSVFFCVFPVMLAARFLYLGWVLASILANSGAEPILVGLVVLLAVQAPFQTADADGLLLGSVLARLHHVGPLTLNSVTRPQDGHVCRQSPGE